jgi:hypothetical protein
MVVSTKVVEKSYKLNRNKNDIIVQISETEINNFLLTVVIHDKPHGGGYKMNKRSEKL